MSLINLWTAALGRLVGRLLGITFDLADLAIDQTDVDLDLGYGRE